MMKVKDIVPAAENNINAIFIILDKTRPTPEGHGRSCLALAADETAAIHLQLWGEECDAFGPGDIVRISDGIFSYGRYGVGLVLRSGRRGKAEKLGTFTMTYVETPNISEIRWLQDPKNPKRFVQDGVISNFSRLFPPLA